MFGKGLSEAIETRKPRTVRFRFASKHNSFWATARVKPWKRGAAIVIRDLSQDERDEINREQLGSRYNFTRLAGSDIFWEWHVGDDRVVVNAAANNLIGGNEGSIDRNIGRSEEHTSELQSLMRISYAVFCFKKKKKINTQD